MTLKKLDHFGRPRPNSVASLSSILYVEDEDTNWNVTELHLRGKYHLQRARDSHETFALLRLNRFDLILLDIQLGGSEYDGMEICKMLKRRPGQYLPDAALDLRCQDIPIVFVTAYAERYEKDELIKKAGADDVITKPVDFTRLRLVTSRLIVKSLF